MSKTVFIAGILVFSLALNGFAEEQQKKVSDSSMAAEAQRKGLRTIFSFRVDLGLSDKQVAEIKKLILGLQNTFVENAKELKVLRQDLSRMIQNREKLGAIHKKIETIARIQVNNTYLDVETSRNIENTLTPIQLKKWQDIQKQTRQKLAVAELNTKQEAAAKVKE